MEWIAPTCFALDGSETATHTWGASSGCESIGNDNAHNLGVGNLERTSVAAKTATDPFEREVMTG